MEDTSIPPRVMQVVHKVVRREDSRAFAWVANSDWEVVYVSPSFSAITGIPHEFAVDTMNNFEKDMYPPDAARLKECFEQATRDQEPFNFRFRVLHPVTQEVFVIQWHALPINRYHPTFWVGDSRVVNRFYPEEAKVRWDSTPRMAATAVASSG